MDRSRFHLAIAVTDLAACRAFYGDVMGFPEGRSVEDWHALASRLKDAAVDFVIEPQVRFEGEVGEQHTMFFLDPSGNALEFKAFADDAQVFST